MTQAKLLGLIALSAVALGAATASAAPVQTEAQHGYDVFKSVGCWECHGTVGQGGAGPRLAPNPLSAENILAIVRKPLKEMPPYHQRILSDQDVFAIHAYLATIKPAPSPDSLEQLRLGPGKSRQ